MPRAKVLGLGGGVNLAGTQEGFLGMVAG